MDFNTVIVIAAGLLTLFNLGDKIVAWIKVLKKPQDDLEQRVGKLEKAIEGEYKLIFADYETRFKRDLERITKLEEVNNLMMKSMLALIRHAETGNNKDQLKKVGEDLQDYIFNK